MTAWTDLIDELRDTALWSVPYFIVEHIVPAVEDAHLDHEQRTGQRPGSDFAADAALHMVVA